MLHEQIQKGIKDAMLAKDAVRLETLRGMIAAFTNELVAKKRKPTEMLTDEGSAGGNCAPGQAEKGFDRAV